MYNYSDIAYANLAAGYSISSIKTYVLALSKEYSDDVELMKQLAISDELEDCWRHGRYLGFMRILYKLRSIYDGRYDLPNELAKHLDAAINDMNKNEDILFEYMSSRGDASFNEITNLHKLAKLKSKIFLNSYLESDSPDESVYFRLSTWVKENCDEPAINFEQKGLLTEMASAINFADCLLEYEKTNSGPEIDEIHTALKEIGAFDKWRKF